MGDSTVVKIPGTLLASGRQAYGSPQMAEWLPVFTQYMWVVHGIRLTWIKINDPSSGGVSSTSHQGGFAADRRTWSLDLADNRRVLYEATKHGCPEYLRTEAQGFEPHGHSMLDVGYKTPCSYQITAMRNGRDGLARNRVDPDATRRPPKSQWLGYRAGITAMRAAIAAANKTIAQEDDMPITDADAAKIALKVWQMQLTAGGKKIALQALAESNVKDTAQSAALVSIGGQLSALAKQVGAPIDEKALASTIIAGLTGKLSAAVHAAVREHLADIRDDELDSIATAVADEFAKRVAA